MKEKGGQKEGYVLKTFQGDFSCDLGLSSNSFEREAIPSGRFSVEQAIKICTAIGIPFSALAHVSADHDNASSIAETHFAAYSAIKPDRAETAHSDDLEKPNAGGKNGSEICTSDCVIAKGMAEAVFGSARRALAQFQMTQDIVRPPPSYYKGQPDGKYVLWIKGITGRVTRYVVQFRVCACEAVLFKVIEYPPNLDNKPPLNGQGFALRIGNFLQINLFEPERQLVLLAKWATNIDVRLFTGILLDPDADNGQVEANKFCMVKVGSTAERDLPLDSIDRMLVGDRNSASGTLVAALDWPSNDDEVTVSRLANRGEDFKH